MRKNEIYINNPFPYIYIYIYMEENSKANKKVTENMNWHFTEKEIQMASEGMER